MEKLVGATLVSFAVALSVACGHSNPDGRSPGANTVRIAIGGQTQLLYLPTTLAQQLGYYRDEGLDVELQDFAGGSKALEALVGGSADVVSGFYDHTIQMQAQNREMTAFVSMLRFPGLVLVTSPQAAPAVKTIADLKGRIVGVTTAGSSSNMLFNYLAQRSGLSADAVSVTAIGGAATAIAAVEHGKVDAGMMGEPAFTMMRARNPSVRILADLRSADGVKQAFGSDTYPASVLYAQSGWIRAHPETARHLARAIVRTLDWMQKHSAQEIADAAPAGFRGEDPVLYVEALKTSLPMFSPDGVMAADGAESVHRLLAGSIPSVRDAHIEISKTYTNEFVSGR